MSLSSRSSPSFTPTPALIQIMAPIAGGVVSLPPTIETIPLTIQNKPYISSFPNSLPEPIIDTPLLRYLNGDLTLRNLDNLTTLTYLEIDGNLNIENCNSLTSISTNPNFKIIIHGNLNIINCDKLKTLTKGSLEIHGNLKIYNCKSLQSLAQQADINENHHISIENISISNCPFFSVLFSHNEHSKFEFKGNLTLIHLPGFISLHPDQKHIFYLKDLDIQVCDALNFEQHTIYTKNTYIYNCIFLKNIFSGEIKGNLTLKNLPELQLEDLADTLRIYGKIELEVCNKITTFGKNFIKIQPKKSDFDINECNIITYPIPLRISGVSIDFDPDYLDNYENHENPNSQNIIPQI